MSDIVERLLRRTFRPTRDMVQAFNEQGNLTNGDALLHEDAAAEITRLRAALAQPGWKLVPVEATPEMLAAAGHSEVPEGQAWLDADARATWAAMLAASPQAPTTKDNVASNRPL